MGHPSVGKRLLDDFRAQPAKSVRAAAAEVDQRHYRRTEQQRIDAVKVVIIPLENLAERLAVIGRRSTGNPRAEVLQLGVVRPHPQRHLATIQDRVIRPADARQVVGRNRRQGGDAISAVNAGQVKSHFMQFVQAGLHGSRDHLDRSRQAGGPRDQQGQLAGRYAAVLRQFVRRPPSAAACRPPTRPPRAKPIRGNRCCRTGPPGRWLPASVRSPWRNSRRTQSANLHTAKPCRPRPDDPWTPGPPAQAKRRRGREPNALRPNRPGRLRPVRPRLEVPPNAFTPQSTTRTPLGSG